MEYRPDVVGGEEGHLSVVSFADVIVRIRRGGVIKYRQINRICFFVGLCVSIRVVPVDTDDFQGMYTLFKYPGV